METWNDIVNNERSGSIENSIHSCELYVYEHECELDDLCDILGYNYFFNEMSIDEIIEQFCEMMLSSYSSGMSGYTYITFFFKRQLYTKRITIETAKYIYQKYLKPNIYQVPEIGYKNLKKTCCEETEFVHKLFMFKKLDDDGQDFVHTTLLEYLKELNVY